MTYIETTYRCAGPGCGQVKREANHWYVMMIIPSENCGLNRGSNLIVTSPWDPTYFGIPNLRPVPACGESCATKIQSAALRGGTWPIR